MKIKKCGVVEEIIINEMKVTFTFQFFFFANNMQQYEI